MRRRRQTAVCAVSPNAPDASSRSSLRRGGRAALRLKIATFVISLIIIIIFSISAFSGFQVSEIISSVIFFSSKSDLRATISEKFCSGLIEFATTTSLPGKNVSLFTNNATSENNTFNNSDDEYDYCNDNPSCSCFVVLEAISSSMFTPFILSTLCYFLVARFLLSPAVLWSRSFVGSNSNNHHNKSEVLIPSAVITPRHTVVTVILLSMFFFFEYFTRIGAQATLDVGWVTAPRNSSLVSIDTKGRQAQAVEDQCFIVPLTQQEQHELRFTYVVASLWCRVILFAVFSIECVHRLPCSPVMDGTWVQLRRALLAGLIYACCSYIFDKVCFFAVAAYLFVTLHQSADDDIVNGGGKIIPIDAHQTDADQKLKKFFDQKIYCFADKNRCRNSMELFEGDTPIFAGKKYHPSWKFRGCAVENWWIDQFFYRKEMGLEELKHQTVSNVHAPQETTLLQALKKLFFCSCPTMRTSFDLREGEIQLLKGVFKKDVAEKMTTVSWSDEFCSLHPSTISFDDGRFLHFTIQERSFWEKLRLYIFEGRDFESSLVTLSLETTSSKSRPFPLMHLRHLTWFAYYLNRYETTETTETIITKELRSVVDLFDEKEDEEEESEKEEEQEEEEEEAVLNESEGKIEKAEEEFVQKKEEGSRDEKLFLDEDCANNILSFLESELSAADLLSRCPSSLMWFSACRFVQRIALKMPFLKEQCQSEFDSIVEQFHEEKNKLLTRESEEKKNLLQPSVPTEDQLATLRRMTADELNALGLERRAPPAAAENSTEMKSEEEIRKSEVDIVGMAQEEEKEEREEGKQEKRKEEYSRENIKRPLNEDCARNIVSFLFLGSKLSAADLLSRCPSSRIWSVTCEVVQEFALKNPLLNQQRQSEFDSIVKQFHEEKNKLLMEEKKKKWSIFPAGAALEELEEFTRYQSLNEEKNQFNFLKERFLDEMNNVREISLLTQERDELDRARKVALADVETELRKNSALRAEVVAAKREVIEMTDRVIAALKERREAQSKVQTLSSRSSQQADKILSLQQKLGDSAERVKTLEKKLAAGEREAVEWLTNDHAAKMKRKDEIIESLNQKVKELSGGHKYEQQLREYEKKIDSLVERQKAERAVVAEKDSQLATVRQQLSAEQSRRTAKEKQREKALNDQSKELETLKKQLAASEEANKQLRCANEDHQQSTSPATTNNNNKKPKSTSPTPAVSSDDIDEHERDDKNDTEEVDHDVQVIIDACLCSKEMAMSALKRSNGSIGDACELVIEEMEG